MPRCFFVGAALAAGFASAAEKLAANATPTKRKAMASDPRIIGIPRNLRVAMDILIRECDAADVARLRADFLAELGHPLPAEFAADVRAWLAQALGTPRLRVWAAEIEGAIAGIVAANPFERIPNGRDPAGRGWYLLNVYTVPRCRGRGIASRLLRAVNEAAAADGVPVLELRATDEARPLYERFGFAASPHYMERMEIPA